MTVYILNNMTIRDKNQYTTYVRAFMPIFLKYGGTVLALQDSPSAIEGSWNFDRTVLLSFPSREAADRWYNSDEYQAIASHRRAGTNSNVAILQGLPSALNSPSAA
jgi:uncharacterized protein (DUF1330 family)